MTALRVPWRYRCPANRSPESPGHGAAGKARGTGEDDRHGCRSMQLLVRAGESSRPRQNDVSDKTDLVCSQEQVIIGPVNHD